MVGVTTPPTYPRIPHLVPGRGSRDDLLLDDSGVAALLGRPAIVEEKVDGANVVVWSEDGVASCALRSGSGGADRAGQLGPLRAWLGREGAAVADLVSDGPVVYGEWMWFAHTVAYDRLPSLLIGLDVWTPTEGFLPPDQRNVVLAGASLPVPPELFRGVVASVHHLESMMGRAAWGEGPMEGVVVRTLDGADHGRRSCCVPGGGPSATTSGSGAALATRSR